MHLLNLDKRHDEAEPFLVMREVIDNRLFWNEPADDDDGKLYSLSRGKLPLQSIQRVCRRDRFEPPRQIIRFETNLASSRRRKHRSHHHRKALYR